MPYDLPPSTGILRRGLSWMPVNWLMYGVLALWITHPLIGSSLQAIPTLPGRSETVPLFNLWTIWWNSDRLANGFRSYWQAPIFFPAADSFAFSEPQPLTAALAPLIWGTGSGALAYNIFLWGSLVLNGFAAERLLRRLGAACWPAILGGSLMTTLPFTLWQLDVLQLVPLWGILWSWTELVSLASRGSAWQGVQFGVATGIACLLCMNLGLLHLMLIAPAALILLCRSPERSRFLVLGVGCLVTITVVAPLAIGLHRAARKHAFERDRDLVRTLSAVPSDYLSRPLAAVSLLPAVERGTELPLHPGWLRLVAAAAGIAWGIRRTRHRTQVLLLLGVTLLACLGSLGPNLRLGGWEPYGTLQKIVPGLSGIRSPFRFACFAQLIATLLAGLGLHGLLIVLRLRMGGTTARTIVGLLGVLIILEIPPDSVRLVQLPTETARTDWIEFLRTRTPPGKGIVCLPLSPGDQVDDFAETTRWMVRGTLHGVPMLNGYSGFFPSEEFSRRELLRDHFPDALARNLLSGLNVEYVVMNRLDRNSPALVAAAASTLSTVFESSDGSIVIFRVHPPNDGGGPDPQPSSGR